jgi:hypothetical protein
MVEAAAPIDAAGSPAAGHAAGAGRRRYILALPMSAAGLFWMARRTVREDVVS